jgi:AcrR family transcriptional regulator
MSRGHFTYYFPTKEDILLAVFDDMVRQMRERCTEDDADFPGKGHTGMALVTDVIRHVLTHAPERPEFAILSYTFLAQVAHRPDFRQRLASIYEHWRTHMAGHLEADLAGRPSGSPASPRAVATLAQAVIHGLVMQEIADPGVIDRSEVLALCNELFGGLVRPPTGGSRDE